MPRLTQLAAHSRRVSVVRFLTVSRNLYNEWVLCTKKADEAGENAKKCHPKRHNALAICPDEWVSSSYYILLYCCTPKLGNRLPLVLCG